MTPFPSNCETGSRQRAFTLVELLVVVVIMALLAAVVIPTLLPAPEARASRGESVVEAPAVLPGAAPILHDARIRVDLLAPLARTARTRGYAAAYRGVFQLSAADPSQPLRLRVPLPEGTEEVEDVRVSLSGGGYDGPVVLSELRVGHGAVLWHGEVPSDARLAAEVRFIAKGFTQLALRLPDATAVAKVDARLDARAVPGAELAVGSLLPRRSDSGVFEWRYESLVSERPIALGLPTEVDALARVLWMLKLSGLALLLFGAGFWYLAEGYRPGWLANFRWRQFTLLALTYSLFFAVFVVLGYEGFRPLPAIGLAAGVSFPLLVWHVATLVDWKFAARYTVPLAGLTIGVVVNGTYGGVWMSYFYLGAVALVVAWLTFTLDDLVAKQNQRRSQVEHELQSRFDDLAALHRDLLAADERAVQVLVTGDGAELKQFRANVAAARDAAGALLNEHERIGEGLTAMHKLGGIERRARRELVASGLVGHAVALRDAQTQLDEQVGRLVRNREQIGVLREAGGDSGIATETEHCLACGHACTEGRHCPQCGTRRPMVMRCRGCGAELSLPLHLLDSEALAGPLYCAACGDRHELDCA